MTLLNVVTRFIEEERATLAARGSRRPSWPSSLRTGFSSASSGVSFTRRCEVGSRRCRANGGGFEAVHIRGGLRREPVIQAPAIPWRRENTPPKQGPFIGKPDAAVHLNL